MLRRMIGKGPKTTELATINFTFGNDTDLSQFSKRAFQALPISAALVAAASVEESASAKTKAQAQQLWDIVRGYRLIANVVTERHGFRRERLLSLVFLLCVEHQMKSLSRDDKKSLVQRLSLSLQSKGNWELSEKKRVSAAPEFPILAVAVRVRQRHAPFVTIHPRLLMRFSPGIELAILEFLSTYQTFLCETASTDDIEYARNGIESLLAHWERNGIPRAGSRTPGLPFLLSWQE